ncbi:MAG: hypothetical protein WCC21_12835 [Candidatus Acidiferrales bacterium]
MGGLIGAIAAAVVILFLFPAIPQSEADHDFDRPILTTLKSVSDHTLKHVIAAVSAYWIVRTLRLRHAIQRA